MRGIRVRVYTCAVQLRVANRSRIRLTIRTLQILMKGLNFNYSAFYDYVSHEFRCSLAFETINTKYKFRILHN